MNNIAKSSLPPHSTNTHFSFHHVGLYVTDLDRSIHFYCDTFGFEFEEKLIMFDEEIAFLKLGQMLLELIQPLQTTTKKHHTLQQQHLALAVNRKSQRFVEIINNSNIEVDDGPYHLQNGWTILFLLGPDGECIEIVQM